MAGKELSFTIAIDGVSNEATEMSKLIIQLQALKKERAELIKQASLPGHLASNEEKQKLAAYNKEIGNQEAALKTLKRVVDTASDSLERKKALLIKLTAESNKASDAVAKSMAPAIKKLNDEIKAGEYARGVFTRNVGNYPELMKGAAGGFRDLTGAVGGTTAEVGNVITSFATAGGVIGVLSTAVGVLSRLWKTTQENIELYLKSADKVAAGPAAFEKDTEIALKDARKRARGEEAEGIRVQMQARSQLNLYAQDYTEEQKKALEAEIASGKKMEENGRSVLNSLISEKDRTAWKIKYNALLTEEEKISDTKLEKETEWEKLEADLIKSHCI